MCRKHVSAHNLAYRQFCAVRQFTPTNANAHVLVAITRRYAESCTETVGEEFLAHLGIERDLWKGLSFGVTGIWRDNDQFIDDINFFNFPIRIYKVLIRRKEILRF